MSDTQISEAHHALARRLEQFDVSTNDAARLIADHERAATAELRAELDAISQALRVEFQAGDTWDETDILENFQCFFAHHKEAEGERNKLRAQLAAAEGKLAEAEKCAVQDRDCLLSISKDTARYYADLETAKNDLRLLQGAYSIAEANIAEYKQRAETAESQLAATRPGKEDTKT